MRDHQGQDHQVQDNRRAESKNLPLIGRISATDWLMKSVLREAS